MSTTSPDNAPTQPAAPVEPDCAPRAGSALLDKLEADLRSIKDAANESAAGDPPAGYDELDRESDALRIADECYHAGFDAMETAIRNWIYDQRHGEPNRPAQTRP